MYRLVTFHFAAYTKENRGYDFSDLPELQPYLDEGYKIDDVVVLTNHASGTSNGTFLVLVKLFRQ